MKHTFNESLKASESQNNLVKNELYSVKTDPDHEFVSLVK